MRVWDLHPGFLNRSSLLGQHAEIHAIFSILHDNKKGYARHPETLRWKEHLALLKERHDTTAKEMTLRGYNHFSHLQFENELADTKNHLIDFIDSPARQFALLRAKYRQKDSSGRIPLPINSSMFWSHYKYSVMARGYNYYKEVQKFLHNRKDYPISEDDEFINLVFAYMQSRSTDKSLQNVLDHLWGYFKKVRSQKERDTFRSIKQCKSFDLQLQYIFALAQKYRIKYLLQSTIFADSATIT